MYLLKILLFHIIIYLKHKNNLKDMLSYFNKFKIITDFSFRSVCVIFIFFRQGSKMDLKVLYTFRTIIQEGGMANAATKLNYSPAALTFQMKQLEKELGTPLFKRSGRHMVLTDNGKALIPFVDDVLQSVAKLKNFGDDLSACQGELTIGAPESLLCFKLPSLLEEFHNRAPKVHLILKSQNSARVRESLIHHELDVGFFYGSQRKISPLLSVSLLGSYPLSLYASPRMKEMYPGLSKPHQNLADVTAIAQPLPGSLRIQFDRYTKEQDIHFGNLIELRSSQAIKSLVRHDIGVCYLPQFVVANEVRHRKLVEIKSAATQNTIDAFYGYRKSDWLSPAMKLLLEICRHAAAGL